MARQQYLTNEAFGQVEQLKASVDRYRAQLTEALSTAEGPSNYLLEQYAVHLSSYNTAANTGSRKSIVKLREELASLDFVDGLKVSIHNQASTVRLRGTMRGLVCREPFRHYRACRLPPVFFDFEFRVRDGGRQRNVVYTTTPTESAGFGYLKPVVDAPFGHNLLDRYLIRQKREHTYKAHPHCYGVMRQCFGDFERSLAEAVQSLDYKGWLCIFKSFLETCNGHDPQGQFHADFLIGDPERRLYPIYASHSAMRTAHGRFDPAWSKSLSRWGRYKSVSAEHRFYIAPREYVELTPEEAMLLRSENMTSESTYCETLKNPMPDIRSRVKFDKEILKDREDVFNLYRNVKKDHNYVIQARNNPF